MNPKEYLNILKNHYLNNELGWRLTTQANPDEDYERRKIKRSLEVLGDTETYDRLLGDEDEIQKKARGTEDFDRIINILSDSLKEDIAECVEKSELGKLEETTLGMLPLSLSEAFCINETVILNDFDDESKLDGYLICINQGLYFSLQLLAKAMVAENLTGDLLDYRTCGAQWYNSAIDMFIKPSIPKIDDIFHRELSAEINGEISAYQASIAMIILQFVALHEYGHICNGDLDAMAVHKLSIIENKSELTLDVQPYHNAEFLADEFALKALCRRSKEPINAWANFSAIYLFFYWLADIEKKIGKPLSMIHPAPIVRAQKLYDIMKIEVGFDSEFSQHMQWIQEHTQKWFNKRSI